MGQNASEFMLYDASDRCLSSSISAASIFSICASEPNRLRIDSMPPMKCKAMFSLLITSTHFHFTILSSQFGHIMLCVGILWRISLVNTATLCRFAHAYYLRYGVLQLAICVSLRRGRPLIRVRPQAPHPAPAPSAEFGRSRGREGRRDET